jgi:hypothetical protein
MQELLKNAKRGKVVLSDYDYQSDVRDRLLLSEIRTLDYQILEEILFSPVKFTIEKLSDNLDLSVEDILPTIEKFLPTALFQFDGTTLTINKEKRKYFETHLQKFEDDFTPGMEFLQNILRSVPIDVLPIWYHIPRSSNNIFHSLIEKYLLTPATYQRYLLEYFSGDDLIAQLAKKIHLAPCSCIPAKELQEKYSLTKEDFTELLLYLEFSLIASVRYERNGDGWEEIVTPFAEWYEYQKFLSSTAPHSISDEVIPYNPKDYSFIEDMKDLLESAFKEPIHIERSAHMDRLINKLQILGLASIQDEKLKTTPTAEEWVKIPIEERSHITFKHPHNFLAIQKRFSHSNQRAVLEIQKGMSLVSGSDWVYFDDFLAGSQIALNEEQKVTLKQIGRSWHYEIPSYSDIEKEFIHHIIFDWLFESGMVLIGTCKGRDCFKLTPLGRILFK